VRLRFTLPEKFLGRLKKGLELPITSPDLPAANHSAKIVELSPVIDPSSGTIEVLAEVIGPPGDLRPGMTVEVRIAGPRVTLRARSTLHCRNFRLAPYRSARLASIPRPPSANM